MTQQGSIARIIISVICCCAIIAFNAYNAIFSTSSQKVNIPTANEQNFFITSGIITNIPANFEENKITNENVAVDNDTSSQSLPAASSGTVSGKVIEKFISPYTANTSYSNVYLKNSTDLSINIKSLLNSPLGYKITKNAEPQVLIVHTHATESFLTQDRNYYTTTDLPRNTDNNYNMVSIGKIVADKLNAAGVVTIHDTTQHDYPSYNESYSRAAKTINAQLKRHPSIKIVIDLHRDAIAANDTDKVKVTTEIEGKKAAQIMIVMGSQSGSVKNFPDWQENLKLALRLQKTVETMYPTLARSLSLMPKNYNESLTTGSMLIEMGTDGNCLEEVKYSAELLSNSLISLLGSME